MDQEKVEGKSTVTARASLFQGEDGFSVGAELEVHIDGVDQAKAEELVKKPTKFAHILKQQEII